MDDSFAAELRSLVDHLAAQGVSLLAVTQGDQRLEIQIRSGGGMPAAPIPAPTVIKAAGPGIFRAGHPGSDIPVPCIEAGDFLFPIAGSLRDEDEILTEDGTIIGYGTALLRRAGLAEGTADD